MQKPLLIRKQKHAKKSNDIRDKKNDDQKPVCFNGIRAWSKSCKLVEKISGKRLIKGGAEKGSGIHNSYSSSHEPGREKISGNGETDRKCPSCRKPEYQKKRTGNITLNRALKK